MIMKKTTTILCLILSLLIVNANAQNIVFGKTPEEQKLRGIAGQIGNYVYTTTYKGNELFINQHSSTTMDIEASKKIATDDIDLKKYSWEIIKVDTKLALIVAVSDRDVQTKIYGKIVVDNDGKLISDGTLKLIGEWKSPEFNGKEIFMGKKIQIASPPEVDGLASTNNKILLYFVHTTMISATNGNKDNLINFILIDKDLNKLDEQNLAFDKKEEYHLVEPIMDTEGNFYFIARAYNAPTRVDHYVGFIYEQKTKKIQNKELPFDKLKKDNKPTALGSLMINSKNNLTFCGFFGVYGQYGVLEATGICTGELTIKGDFTYDFKPIDKELFSKSFADANDKTDHVMSRVEITTTENYVVISKSNTGYTKKDAPSGSYFMEYSIFKIDETGKLKIVNSYASEIYNDGLYEKIRPSFVEGKDKLFMVIAPSKDYCKSLNITKPSVQVCILNTFNLKGDLQSTFLYNIEKTNPIPRNKYVMKNGNLLLWGDSNQGSVKIDLK